MNQRPNQLEHSALCHCFSQDDGRGGKQGQRYAKGQAEGGQGTIKRTRVRDRMPLFRGGRVEVALGLLGDIEGVLVFVFGGHCGM